MVPTTPRGSAVVPRKYSPSQYTLADGASRSDGHRCNACLARGTPASPIELDVTLPLIDAKRQFQRPAPLSSSYRAHGESGFPDSFAFVKPDYECFHLPVRSCLARDATRATTEVTSQGHTCCDALPKSLVPLLDHDKQKSTNNWPLSSTWCSLVQSLVNTNANLHYTPCAPGWAPSCSKSTGLPWCICSTTFEPCR